MAALFEKTLRLEVFCCPDERLIIGGAARGLLLRPEASPAEIWKALSALRTHLKIDIGVQVEEASVKFAEPEEKCWS
jgi:hypothetical protein